MTEKNYSSHLFIDLEAVRQNCRDVIKRTGKPLMAVVKANAYGFGAVRIAKACEEGGASSFAVSRLAEALELREAGILKDILVFTLLDRGEYRTALENHLTVSLSRFDQIEILNSVSKETGVNPKIHIKVNTGMNRLGFNSEELPKLIEMLHISKLPVEGIFSHYANIDEDPNDPLNSLQRERFIQAVHAMNQAGFHSLIAHMTNSAAVYNSPDSYFDLVRLGSSLLGVNPFYYDEKPDEIQNVLEWKTRLISVRDVPAGESFGYSQLAPVEKPIIIGVIPVGYADGFHRVQENYVIIRGKKHPVVGSICSDISFVLLDRHYPLDEEVILIGRQGDVSLTIEELADQWNTTRADVTSGITHRVGRVYRN